MRKGFNTLNEEINRMKSLFTEERMFGNLVEQEKVLTEGNVLKMGSKGKEVEALQNLLSITPVDGDFGKITKSKVEEFQKNNGLSVDGVVGEKTLNVIVKKFAEAGNITNNQNESIIREQSLKFDKNNLNNLKILTKGITLDTKLPNPFQGNPFKGRTLEDIINDKMNQDLQKMRNNKGSDDGGGTDNKGSDDGGGTDNKGSEAGGDDKKGTYDDQNKGSEEEGEAKAGTKRKGTEFYQKGKSKNTVKAVLASVKTTKGEINDNVKACKNGMKQLYKQIVKIGDANLELTENELEGLDWCMSTFKNRFEKLGFGIGREEAEEIYDTLNREIPELKDTVEGEKYDVKDDSDLVVAKLKRLGPGKYSFNGRKGYIIATKDRKDGRMKISGDFQKYLLRTLKKDSNNWKIVTISKKTGKNNGQFLVRKK
jgi:peptidoglycan hydrolase-like protein with peptidoglycan-binding domain